VPVLVPLVSVVGGEMIGEDEEAIEVLLLTKASELSQWETDFLESIAQAEVLSEKQSKKLDDIWKRVMES